jgi:hypothetical protein
MSRPTAGRNGNSASPIRLMRDRGFAACRIRYTNSLAMLVVVVAALAGCGKSQPAVDPAPFEAAVNQYLQRNDMALKIKEIRQGPTVDGDRATMTASMTSRDVGGFSVVWEIQFQRGANGQWTVTGHQN